MLEQEPGELHITLSDAQWSGIGAVVEREPGEPVSGLDVKRKNVEHSFSYSRRHHFSNTPRNMPRNFCKILRNIIYKETP